MAIITLSRPTLNDDVTEQKRLVRLKSLHQVPLLPEKYTPCMDLLVRLRKIDRIQISEMLEREGELPKYIIDIYFVPGSANRIPTNRDNFDTPVLERQPDFRMARVFKDFTELRNNLHRQVRDSHTFDRCAYCEKFTNFILSGKTQPSTLMTWFYKQDRVKRELTHFLTDVLQFALGCKPSVCRNCATQQRVPEIVTAFLFGQQAVASNTMRTA